MIRRILTIFACGLLGAPSARGAAPRLEAAMFIFGNTQSVVVSEFADLSPCTIPVIERIERDSDEVTIHWKVSSVADTSGMSRCASIRRARRIDSIPLRSVRIPAACGVGMPCTLETIPRPTSLKECHGGQCTSVDRRILGGTERNDTGCNISRRCEWVESNYTITNTEWMRRMVDSSKIVQLVHIGPRRDAQLVPGSLATNPFYLPPFPAEKNFQFDLTPLAFPPTSNPGLRWDVIDSELALPSPGNIADYFAAETMSIEIVDVRTAGNQEHPKFFATGWSQYHYRSRQTRRRGDSLVSVPTLVDDTLLLDGLSLIVNNSGASWKLDVATEADPTYASDWLFITQDTVTPFRKQFTKTWSVFSQNSRRWRLTGPWNDPNTSVVLAGGGPFVPLSDVLTIPMSVTRDGRLATFRAVAYDGHIELHLPGSSPIEITDMRGRILSQDRLAKGTHRIPAPRGGILLVRTRFGTRVLVTDHARVL